MLSEYSFDEIYIRHAKEEGRKNEQNFFTHIHEQCEIFFFLSGDVEYLVEGTKYQMEENQLMIMRPAESHAARITGSAVYERYAINFPVSFARAIDPEGRLMQPFFSRALGEGNLLREAEFDAALVKELFAQMCQTADDSERQLTIRTHLITLLALIRQAYKKRGDAEKKQPGDAERMVAYVNRKLFADISVPMLAKHFYLSPSQFSRLFKRATGAAPWEYITRKRLTAAREKLRAGAPA